MKKSLSMLPAAFLIFLINLLLITQNLTAQENCSCAYCSCPCNQIANPSSHESKCPYSKTTSTSTSTSSSGGGITETDIQTMVAGAIINSIFSTTNNSEAEKQKLEAERLEQERIAAELAEQQRIQDSIDQAKYENLINSSKDLPGSDNGGFKPITSTSSPLVMDTAEFNNLEGEAEALRQQSDLENLTMDWIKLQQDIINERLKKDDSWCDMAYNTVSAGTYFSPEEFAVTTDLLIPGDVILVDYEGASEVLNIVDNKVSGTTESTASHALMFLKHEFGTNYYLDSQPNKGPRVICEEEFIKTYGSRGMNVATRRAAPLSAEQADKLIQASYEKEEIGLTGNYILNRTAYGLVGEDQICTEVVWEVLNAAGGNIPGTDNSLKQFFNVDFTMADFYLKDQYFFITKLKIK